jgi:hypothetical protein
MSKDLSVTLEVERGEEVEEETASRLLIGATVVVAVAFIVVCSFNEVALKNDSENCICFNAACLPLANNAFRIVGT